MPIQVERAVNAIKHELGTNLSAGLTALEVVEMAYTEIFSSREGWSWVLRSVALDMVEGDQTIRLPADFQNLYQPSDDDIRIRVLQDPDFYQFQEDGNFRTNDTFMARLDQDDEGWFLEFGEPFATSKEGQFRVNYEAGPVAITDSEQTLPLPMHMHRLLLSLCRGIAKGYEESDETSVEIQVAHVLNGPTFDAAVKADIRIRVKPMGRRRARPGRWNLGDGTLAVTTNEGVVIWPS